VSPILQGGLYQLRVDFFDRRDEIPSDIFAIEKGPRGQREEGDVDQKHQIFPPRSSFRIALARADAPIPKCPGTSAIKISISRFKRKVNISIDGFEQRALLHNSPPYHMVQRFRNI
jgi:hypothetical protein